MPRPTLLVPGGPTAAPCAALLPLVALPLVALPFVASQAAGQGLLDPTARLAPTVVSYTVRGDAPVTVTQSLLPVAAAAAWGPHVTFDVATAYLHASAERPGGAASRIAGLTDTQMRASYTLGTDAMVVTAGLNLPTGRYAVGEAQLDAAGLIGNDFLLFPVSSAGDGLAATLGAAAARAVGTWNVGAGLAARQSSAFDAFAVPEGTVRFRPASEYRMRVGADRTVGDGEVSAGVTYSAFGRDAAGPTTYGSGDRVIVQASFAQPVDAMDVRVDAWTLHQAAGEMVGGRAPRTQVTSVALSAGWPLRGGSIEPNVELRDWRRDGARAGTLALVGARGRLPSVRGFALLPSAGVAVGQLAGLPAEGVRSAGVRGWQLSLAVRR